MKFFIILTSLLAFVSCAERLYKVKLDQQIYVLPNAQGQKLKGLIYYKNYNIMEAFSVDEKLEGPINGVVKKMEGDKIIPLYIETASPSLFEEASNKSKMLYIKGYIIDEL